MSNPLLIIDPGHGGMDSGGGSNKHWLEKEAVLELSKYQYDRFKELGIDVVMTRDEDEYLNANERSKRVRESGATFCISNHVNAGGGEGAEVIHSIHSEKSFATEVFEELGRAGQKLRRVFTRTLENSSNLDYYYMHRLTGNVETIIVEYGFADNESDVKRLIKNWRSYADAVIKGFCTHVGIEYKDKEYENHTFITGKSYYNSDRIIKWIDQNNGSEMFKEAIKYYTKYGELTGIRSDVLLSQAAKETGFGKYGGAVTKDMNNFAGIKIKNPTGDTKGDFETFASIEDGVRAHFNHMCAYVGIEPIGIVHDRYYVVKNISWAGTIKYVEQLGGTWSVQSDYGNDLVKNYITPLRHFIGHSKDHWAEYAYHGLNEAGISIYEKRYDEKATRGEAMAIAYEVYKNLAQKM